MGDDGKSVSRLKVAELREELQRRGLPTDGLKGELVDRLAAAMAASPAAKQQDSPPAKRSRVEEEEEGGEGEGEGEGHPAVTTTLHDDDDGGTNATEVATQATPAPAPPTGGGATLDQLLDDYPDEEDFEVVVQGVAGSGAAAPDADGGAASSSAATTGDPAAADGKQAGATPGGLGDRNMPAFRFSSLSTALTVRTTAEQEEALRVTGVTPDNYWEKLNPGGVGMVEGVKKRAFEINLDEIDFPRWRDPGAVISDFFNYGMNEHTWKEYAARQVALKLYRQQQLLKSAQEAAAAASSSSSSAGGGASAGAGR